VERQTEFVLKIFKKLKENADYSGYYVELGSRHFRDGNNTYILEKNYG
jgi:hypothetical protein